jgi:hypothetical protein
VKFITYGEEETHAAKLRAGLAKLSPQFVAEVCWWCDGTGRHKFEHCTVCGADKMYGTALGLLINNRPAPESVVNQVLVAADG